MSQYKNTPSDNRGQKAQNSNMEDAQNSKTSGATDFDDTQREAFQSRESGLNESRNRNKEPRGSDQDSGN